MFETKVVIFIFITILLLFGLFYSPKSKEQIEEEKRKRAEKFNQEMYEEYPELFEEPKKDNDDDDNPNFGRHDLLI